MPSSADLPVYRQLYLRFRQSIAEGRLRPGDRVPSVRALAAELNLARGTVDSAYQLLIGEGYLLSRGPAGTVVSPQLQASAQTLAPSLPPAAMPSLMHGGGAPLALQMGLPALDLFPRKTWNRLASRELRRSGIDGLVYPDARGLPPLRTAVASYLGISRGIVCAPEQVFIGAGYRACLQLICTAVLQRGDRCWFEDPGYFMARRVLEAADIELIPVRVDAHGLDIDAGLQAAPQARCALVTPTHQSPLGVSLSLPRRQALLDWANRQGSWIIEDDYDSEYRYHGRPLPALKSLDREGRVLYCGTFSKVLMPGLRLAYLVVPPAQVERFSAVADALHNHCPQLLQATVARFMEDGHFARHLNKTRSLYAQRRQGLSDALQREFGAQLQIDAQAGGMHLLARLPAGTDDQAIVAAARKVGLSMEPLSTWYLRAPPCPGLLMGFTNVADAVQASDVAARLRSVL
ncbi:PLP-dependent aminotransferase family protein [Pseudomonas sp. MWU16-30317]|uniref:MocR-like pyridoxine biosynthesis transcription factor PdxR n=1 Tax=Pseudomonas sp. MWU16-30317 TaxID=2878095 RepID=UPI001CF9872E|nr:PLP-dependent aminotransferase family protein [Pseudomonas sp. MWU16-30317]